MIGSGATNNELAAEKKVWVYLGKLKKYTSTEAVETYLGEVFPGFEITVDTLESKDQTAVSGSQRLLTTKKC